MAQVKIVEASWLHLRQFGPEIDKELCGVTTSPTLLSPVLVWNQQKYQMLTKTVACFEIFQGGCPRDPSQRECGCVNESITSRPYRLPTSKVLFYDTCVDGQVGESLKKLAMNISVCPTSAFNAACPEIFLLL